MPGRRGNQQEHGSQQGKDWAALKSKLQQLMDESGLTSVEIHNGWGIGEDTIGRIMQGRAKDVQRSTLTLLSIIFHKHRDYLYNIHNRRPAIETPEPTLASLQESLDSMRAEFRQEIRWQGDVLRRIAPAVGVQVEPYTHGPRNEPGERDELAQTGSPQEKPLPE